jgi:hypothetical protein
MMRKLTYLMFAALTCVVGSSLMAESHAKMFIDECMPKDATNEIPEINVHPDFQKTPDVAQYGEGDWSKVIGIAHRIRLAEAFEIATRNPEITYFFYMKGSRMVLNTPDGNFRVFRRGDAVFFAGEPWWGSAPGFADGYIKQPQAAK